MLPNGLGDGQFEPEHLSVDETVLSFGQKILAAGAGLEAKKPAEVVQSDMKIYTGGGYQFAISQAEVSDLYELDEHIRQLVQALMTCAPIKDLTLPC